MSDHSFQKITPRGEHDDDNELTPEEIATKKRRRIWIIAMCVIIVAGGIVAANARNISRGIKSWQAERAATEAGKLIEARDFKSAQGKVQDALALSPTNLVAQRTAARFLTAAGGYKDALGFWNEVEKTSPLTLVEQRDYTTCVLALGDVLQAEKRLKLAWPDNTPGTPSDWMLALNLALQGRNEAKAISLAEKIMASTEAAPDQRLKAASLMTSATDLGQRTAAWKLIVTLSQDKTTTGLEALVLLARQAATTLKNKDTAENSLDLPDAITIADELDANPKAQTKHYLFAMELRLLINPLEKEKFVTQAEEKFSGNDDDLEALTSWLYGKGEFRKILHLLTPEVASHRRSLFLQSLDTMAAMGDWKKVADSINTAAFSLDRVTAEMYLARCSKELGEKAGTENHWNAAIEASNGNSQLLLQVADYAEKSGNIAIAKKAYLAAVDARADLLPAFQRLLIMAQSESDTTALNSLLKRMAIQWPDEAAVKNDLAYTNLLLKQEIEESTRVAEELFTKQPQSLPHRITLSLARLRAGNKAEAVALLDKLAGDLGPLAARKSVVSAAALWANGQQTEAKAALDGVNREQLFPEERELVSEIQ